MITRVDKGARMASMELDMLSQNGNGRGDLTVVGYF